MLLTQYVPTFARKITQSAPQDLMVNLISAKHKCGSGPDPHPARAPRDFFGGQGRGPRDGPGESFHHDCRFSGIWVSNNPFPLILNTQ